MYANAGYLNDADIEIEDNSHPLIVSGCGVYRRTGAKTISFYILPPAKPSFI